jgi:hypothetical protein
MLLMCMHSDSRVLTYSDECFVNLFSKFAAVLSNKIVVFWNLF